MRIQMQADPPPRDSELIQKGRMAELPKEHWCRDCAWATCLMDRFLCPYVEGSCAKIPETILNPDPQLMAEHMMHEKQRKWTQEDQCPSEGKFAKKYTIDGESHSIKVWAYLMGISESTIYRRMREGMSPRDAILRSLPKDE